VVQPCGLLGLSAQAAQGLVQAALGLAPLLLAVVDVRHGDDGGQVAGIELQRLIEPRFGLVEKLWVLEQNPRQVGQHRGLGGGGIAHRQLPFVELPGFVAAAFRGFERSQRAQGVGVRRVFLHGPFETDRA
jgi:hypothetical protein